MIVAITSIVSAVLLSITSVYFSVDGWMTLFSGAALAIGIMVGVFELAKIAATIWLYNYWKMSPKTLKTYFFIAILILVVISSIGIYGFLISSYVGQEVSTQRVENQIAQVQGRIDRERNDIERAENQLAQLNAAIDRYIELDVVTRGLEQREEQEPERERLRERIRTSEEQIGEYEDRLYELRQQLNAQQVDVGPIKYIAAVLYGEEQAGEYYDNAVRWLSLVFVVVFDPFAVLLMVAGNIALQKRGQKKDGRGRSKGSKNKRKPQSPSSPSVKESPAPESESKEEESKPREEPEPASTSRSEKEEEQASVPELPPEEATVPIPEDQEPPYVEDQTLTDQPPRLHRRKSRRRRKPPR